MSNLERRNEETAMTVGASAPPAWLAEVAANDTSTAELAEFRIVPRLKIVQGSSRDKSLKALPGIGGVALMPERSVIAMPGDTFTIVPLFFWTEVMLMSDLLDKESPMALERHTDRTHEGFALAANPDSRMVPYKNGEFKARWVQSLNFASVIVESEQSDAIMKAAVVNFSKGEFNNGKAFSTAVMGRRIGGSIAPLWSQRWRLATSERNGEKGDWYGYDFSSPEQAYIEEAQAKYFEEQHEALKADFKAGLLGVAADEDDAHDGADSGSPEADSEFSG